MEKIFGSEESLQSAFMTLTKCGEEEAFRFLPLLLAARNKVARRIKNVPITKEVEEELLYLTAAMAAEQWEMTKNEKDQSIKVGEISLSERGTLSEWRTLVGLLEASCTEFLKDQGFYFTNTGGI